MTTLLLRLAAPMQSWGDSSRFTTRHTRSVPTKSGVLGLLAAAEGRRRADPLEDLAGLRFGVRADQPGVMMSDFQTAIRWRTHDPMPLSTRYYIADAVFIAGVEGEAGLLAGLADAIRAPAFPLYLGRRSCPVAGDVYLDVVEGGLEAALRGASWQAAHWYRRSIPNVVSLDLYLDAAPGSGDELQRDVPVSFDPERREYVWRDVRHTRTEMFDNPLGRLPARQRPSDFFETVSNV